MLVYGIAIIPGFFNMFLLISLLLDKRPKYTNNINNLPPITILVAAYNEEDTIFDTLVSIAAQQYPNQVEVLICDDGSYDGTKNQVYEFCKLNQYKKHFNFKLLSYDENKGKSYALNNGLLNSTYDHIITIDADSYLYKNALINLVSNYYHGPKNTASVAGTVLVRNSRKNWLTKLQEWEYFIALSLVKRTQSLYQGTLVAQGAFSIYSKRSLQKLGGWPHVVGEDIVLTWGIQNEGHRVGHAENAIIFTNVPETYKVFLNQRRRWARGLIEAFKQYPATIWTIKTNTIFIWLNLLFPFLDFMFLFGFVPGLIFALLFQWYEIVSMLTLLLLPMALTINYFIYTRHMKTFEELGLKIRKNYIGFINFMLFSQLFIVPACLCGYLDEFLKLKKQWGTKQAKYIYSNERLYTNKLTYILLIVVIITTLAFLPILLNNINKEIYNYNIEYYVNKILQ